MSYLSFFQIDVFSERLGDGNPLAVVVGADALPERALQRFARWTNLSETTFLVQPTESGRAAGADYLVRIFTPSGELPFAGHPTLGSCHAWLASGGKPARDDRIVQECGVGLVQIRHSHGRLAFAAPPMTPSAPRPALLALVTHALGLRAPQIVAARLLDNGPRWLSLLLDSRDTVLNLRPDHARMKDLDQNVGVAYIDSAEGCSAGANANVDASGDERASAAPQAVVRAFAPSLGITEDPVTGSLHASLAQWLIGEGLAPTRYVAAQGEGLGRAGRVHIEQDAAGQVWVGGRCLTAIEGRVHFP